ncbi:RNA polymerase sigma factor [Cnuella takakiae]|nr:RNA polymerase sigma factor [Cnuella takakiae]OLY92133.1 RNA polymerase subunit sigma-24 [Cnuella takakiae]
MQNLPQIISLCVQRHAREQRMLYEHYYGYCLKVVFRYIYHYDKAVDVVNDGFVKIFCNLHRFEAPDPAATEQMLMGWMRRIMVNTAVDHLRKNNFTPEIGEISEAVWQPADKGQLPDQALLYKELIKEVKKLPPGYRAVFNMYVLDGMTHPEIAEALGISVGTSKSNLFKARSILQNILKKNDAEAIACNM